MVSLQEVLGSIRSSCAHLVVLKASLSSCHLRDGQAGRILLEQLRA